MVYYIYTYSLFYITLPLFSPRTYNLVRPVPMLRSLPAFANCAVTR